MTDSSVQFCIMEESIGRYIQRTLRYKGISNEVAGQAIGISESAFEKILTKDDILLSRLLKLSKCAGVNFLDYLNDKDPIAAFKKEEQQRSLEEIEMLNEKLKLKDEIIQEKERTIFLQQQLIDELRKQIGIK